MGPAARPGTGTGRRLITKNPAKSGVFHVFTVPFRGPLSGCAHQSFSIEPGAQALSGQKPTKEKWQSFFISGIGQTEE